MRIRVCRAETGHAPPGCIQMPKSATWLLKVGRLSEERHAAVPDRMHDEAHAEERGGLRGGRARRGEKWNYSERH